MTKGLTKVLWVSFIKKSAFLLLTSLMSTPPLNVSLNTPFSFIRTPNLTKANSMNTRTVSTVEVKLPLPPAALHTHAKGHWRQKSKATAEARQVARWAAKEAVSGQSWEHAEIDYLFRLPDNRRRDAANLVAACKSYVDGVVDAGLIPDDCWQMLSIGAAVCEIDRDDPGVTLVFRKV